MNNREEFYEVKQRVKNMPWKRDEFIKGYKLVDTYILGGYSIGESCKKELIETGAIVRISKKELTRILIGRNVI